MSPFQTKRPPSSFSWCVFTDRLHPRRIHPHTGNIYMDQILKPTFFMATSQNQARGLIWSYLMYEAEHYFYFYVFPQLLKNSAKFKYIKTWPNPCITPINEHAAGLLAENWWLLNGQNLGKTLLKRRPCAQINDTDGQVLILHMAFSAKTNISIMLFKFCKIEPQYLKIMRVFQNEYLISSQQSWF